MKKIFLQLIGVALTAYASLASAAGEVKLQQVSSVTHTKYGQSQQNVHFEANVANIAFNKQVFAHYKLANGTWVDIPLSYNRLAETNREIWSTDYNPALNDTNDVQFALKYVVNGQTYWDNNSGSNYFIAKDSGVILANGLNVYDLYYSPTRTLGATDQTFYGTLTVRNLAFSKSVTVLYSTDNWATSQVATATFSPDHWIGSYSTAANPNSYGFEVWDYALNIGSASQVDYAIKYVVNGQTYWDNNFGNNYHTIVTRRPQ